MRRKRWETKSRSEVEALEGKMFQTSSIEMRIVILTRKGYGVLIMRYSRVWKYHTKNWK